MLEPLDTTRERSDSPVEGTLPQPVLTQLRKMQTALKGRESVSHHVEVNNKNYCFQFQLFGPQAYLVTIFEEANSRDLLPQIEDDSPLKALILSRQIVPQEQGKLFVQIMVDSKNGCYRQHPDAFGYQPDQTFLMGEILGEIATPPSPVTELGTEVSRFTRVLDAVCKFLD